MIGITSKEHIPSWGYFIDFPKTPRMERPIGENLKEIKYKTTCML